jgi:pimeloyl-ACP methyl ester carboxylesterase
VLIGSSLGGYIGTLVAEKPDGLVDGVLALGAGGFPVSEDEIARTFTTRPKIPLLFLSNGEEADGPRMYARKSPPGSVAVWSVKRKRPREPERA